MRIGFVELIVIILLLVTLFDPTKLKTYAASLGSAIAELSKTIRKVNEEVVEPVQNDVIEPVKKDVVEPIKDALNGGK